MYSSFVCRCPLVPAMQISRIWIQSSGNIAPGNKHSTCKSRRNCRNEVSRKTSGMSYWHLGMFCRSNPLRDNEVYSVACTQCLVWAKSYHAVLFCASRRLVSLKQRMVSIVALAFLWLRSRHVSFIVLESSLLSVEPGAKQPEMGRSSSLCLHFPVVLFYLFTLSLAAGPTSKYATYATSRLC